MSGFAGFFRDRFVLSSRNHACVGVLLIRLERRLRAVHFRHIRPQLLRTVATALADMKRNDLACRLVHSDPAPLRSGLLLPEAPHLVCFNLKTPHEPIPWGRNGLHLEMIRQRLKTSDDTRQEPPDTDANRAANAVQGDFSQRKRSTTVRCSSPIPRLSACKTHARPHALH